MAGRRIALMDIRELVRHLRASDSDRAVQRNTSIDRRTVQRYRTWAAAQGLLTGPLPALEELQRLVQQTLTAPAPPHMVSSVEPFRVQVVELRAQATEMMAIWERLKERGYTGSYSAIRRFVRTLEPRQPEAFGRVETAPGEEAQVDFGYAGRMLDPQTGQLRKTWAFVMVLGFSRHQYVEFVWDQSVATWLVLHRHAFEFFGGVPKRIVLDNLKAAITKACWDDPQVQQAYRECAEHYGFLIAPCRPRTPEHKGKVEQGGVHYVKRNALAGRNFRDLHDGNRHLLRWTVETAGRRVHGTTKQIPLEVFDQVERAALQPLPVTPWELTEWKRAKLHPDCHVVFAGAYYSAPHRLIGQRLWVRATDFKVELYQDYVLVATHRRARPGQRRTLAAHLPPDKVHFLLQTPTWCRARAADVGPACQEFIEQLLGDRPLDRLRSAQGILRLGQRYSPTR